MPDTMSIERRNLLKAYGAEVVLTDGSKGMNGAIEKANELAKEIENSFIPDQFNNEANPAAHYRTGDEIWRDTDGKVKAFVAGVGTGGTLSGVSVYLKKQNPDIKIVGVEPASSPMISEGKASPHKIQGIGANFVPANFKSDRCDEIICITNEEAYEAGREVAECEGILVGISSGASLAAARKLSERGEYDGEIIVVVAPDSGEHYLSVPDYLI
jgi:cysteine synthase A